MIVGTEKIPDRGAIRVAKRILYIVGKCHSDALFSLLPWKGRGGIWKLVKAAHQLLV